MSSGLRPGALGLIIAAQVAAFPAWAAPDTDAPRISHVRVSKAPLGKAITIRAQIQDRSAVFAPSVLIRPRGRREFDTLDMKKSGNEYEAVIAAEQVTGDLEYVIEAFDEHGNGPAREGSPESPLVISVFDPTTTVVEPDAPPSEVEPELVPKDERPQDGDDSVVKKWWFWTLIGVAAAGGATAVILATSGGTPDQVELVVNGPDPAAGL